MRTEPNYGEAFCSVCGKPFRKKAGNQVYCGRECYTEANRNNARLYQQNHYMYRRVKPREITCSRCGHIFMGKNNQKICMDCLTTRKDCRRYLWQRSESMAVVEP